MIHSNLQCTQQRTDDFHEIPHPFLWEEGLFVSDPPECVQNIHGARDHIQGPLQTLVVQGREEVRQSLQVSETVTHRCTYMHMHP